MDRRVNLSKRQAIGAKIAKLVIAAEALFPAPKSGAAKRTWVLRQARKESPKGDGPSHDFARWLGAALLRVAIEAAVAMLNRLEEQP